MASADDAKLGSVLNVLIWSESDVAAFIRSLNPPYYDTYATAIAAAVGSGLRLIIMQDAALSKVVSNPLHRLHIAREIKNLLTLCQTSSHPFVGATGCFPLNG